MAFGIVDLCILKNSGLLDFKLATLEPDTNKREANTTIWPRESYKYILTSSLEGKRYRLTHKGKRSCERGVERTKGRHLQRLTNTIQSLTSYHIC
ncbi:hypothetical protein ANTRET_LOCUS1609 [Anthophora retusa]